MKKKIFLISILSLLLNVFGFSQYKYKVTKCDSHIKTGNEWVLFQENYPTRMFLYAEGATFKIDNKDNSVYKLVGDSTMQHYPEFTTYTFNAYDKNEEGCKAVITQLLNDDCTFYFSVFYEAKCYNYKIVEID